MHRGATHHRRACLPTRANAFGAPAQSGVRIITSAATTTPYAQPRRAAKAAAAVPKKTPPASPSHIATNKQSAMNFSSCTISSDLADLDDREWVDPTPIPATLLELVPPVFTPPRLAPNIVNTKSSSNTKSRIRKEPRAHARVPFPSCVVEGPREDRPWRVPQMSAARGRTGDGRSGGIKGVITPDPGLAKPNVPDGGDFWARGLSYLFFLFFFDKFSSPLACYSTRSVSFLFSLFFFSHPEICARPFCWLVGEGAFGGRVMQCMCGMLLSGLRRNGYSCGSCENVAVRGQ